MDFRLLRSRYLARLVILFFYEGSLLGQASTMFPNPRDSSKTLLWKVETSTEILRRSLAVKEIINAAEVSDLHIILEPGKEQILDAFFENFWRHSALPCKIFSDLNAWKGLFNDEGSYLQYATTLLIGDSKQLLEITTMIFQLYKKKVINIKKTRWIYFVTEYSASSMNISNENFPGVKTSQTFDRPSTLSLQSERFKSFIGELSSIMFDGMQAVISDMSRDNEWSKVASAAYEAQEWRVRFCGVFSPRSGLSLIRQLWPTHTRNFNGRTFRVTCLQKLSTFIFNEANPTLEGATGYAAEITKLIVNKLNISTVLVPTTSFGSWTGTSWSGMIGKLAEDEADIAPMDFTPQLQRARVAQFAYFIGTDPNVLCSKAPGIRPRPFLLLQIFNYQVWSFITTGLLVYGLMMTVIMRIENQLMANQWDPQSAELDFLRVSYHASFVFRQYVFQSSNFLPKTFAARMLSCFLFLTTLVINATYQGSITAFLALPVRSATINSVDDLAKSSVIPVLKVNSGNEIFFSEQKSGVLFMLNKRAERFTTVEVSSWKFLSQIASGKYSLIDTLSSHLGRRMLYEKKGEECMFHISEQPLMTNLDAFAYAKNSLLELPVDNVIRWLNNYGINEAIKKKYFLLPCIKQMEIGERTLTITQIQGAFYVYIIGIIVCVVGFLAELLAYKLLSK